MPSQKKNKPLLVVLAGGNGSGKSTFYRLYLKPRGIPFINADEIARSVWPENSESHSYEAMQLAETARKTALSKQRSFCFESVFSHASKRDFLKQARLKGFEIHLYMFNLSHPGIHVGRVKQRVEEGGHNVPVEKILARIPRSIANLKNAISLCDRVLLLDNSNHTNPYVQQALFHRGKWSTIADPVSDWALEFINHKHSTADLKT